MPRFVNFYHCLCQYLSLYLSVFVAICLFGICLCRFLSLSVFVFVSICLWCYLSFSVFVFVGIGLCLYLSLFVFIFLCLCLYLSSESNNNLDGLRCNVQSQKPYWILWLYTEDSSGYIQRILWLYT